MEVGVVAPPPHGAEEVLEVELLEGLPPPHDEPPPKPVAAAAATAAITEAGSRSRLRLRYWLGDSNASLSNESAATTNGCTAGVTGGGTGVAVAVACGSEGWFEELCCCCCCCC